MRSLRPAAVAAAFMAQTVLAQTAFPETPPGPAAAQLIAKAERQKGEKQVRTYIEACEAGAGAACTEAAKLGRPWGERKRTLTDDEVAALLEEGCRLGGEAECQTASEAAELKATWRLGADFEPEQTSSDTGYEMAMLGCERGSAHLCWSAAYDLARGYRMEPDFDAALAYFETACGQGLEKACERAAFFSGADPEALALEKEKASLRWLDRSYQLATQLPDDHPARVIARKQFSTTKIKEKTQYQFDACNAGDPMSCFDLGFALELRLAYKDAPAGVNKRDLLMRACELGLSQGCHGAARITYYGPLRYVYYDNSRELYERACLQMANPLACDDWGQWIEDDGDIDDEAQLIRTLYRKSCIFRNKMDNCEKLDAFEQKMTPELVAARMATKQALVLRKRVVPWGAYDTCAGPESVALGQAVDAGNGASAFTKFTARCGGEYTRPELKAACDRLPDGPAHHKLLCSGVLAELEGDDAITATGWSVSAKQLSENFRLWPSDYYLDRTNTGHMATPFNPDTAVQTGYAGPLQASLFPEVSGLAEIRTTIGDSVFRLVLQDRGFVILSPIDPVNSHHRNGIYSYYVFTEGVTPEDHADGRGIMPSQKGATRMEHRAAWNEAAGKWDVETASFFEIPWGEDWQEIAQGNLYAFLPSGITPQDNAQLCCGISLYIPFKDGKLNAHALQRTTMASLYGGTITPDVAEAMRIALNDAPKGNIWYTKCGERPYVSTAGMRGTDFDNTPDAYSLRREQDALNRRIDWYYCQQDAFNADLVNVRAFLNEHRAKPPTDPMRWRAALMLSRYEAHRGKLESEADTLDSYSTTIVEAASAYKSQQRARLRAERAERKAAEQSRPSAADDFYYRNSGAYYSDCLSGAQSYGQQQGCMDQWLANADGARAQRSGDASGDSNDYSGVVVLTREEFPAAEAPEVPVSTYRPPEPEPQSPQKPICPEGYTCNCGPTPIPVVENGAACR